MALLMNQNEQRSKLQEEIAAELQERARLRASKRDMPDGVDDSEYIKGTKQTTTLAWVWVLIVLAFIGILIWMATAL